MVSVCLQENCISRPQIDCGLLNISFNEQLTILSVVCLCSYSSVRGIRASLRGLKLEERDLLFLVKSFLRLGNGQTDTLEGDSFLMRWTLFLIYFLKIFDEHLRFVNISKYTTNVCAYNATSHQKPCIFIFMLFHVIVLFHTGGVTHYLGV